MNTLAKRKGKMRPQPIRQDGLATRNQLLQAAGEVFAEQGYAKATSKDICRRANANIAAVNYHFGGKEGLYSAVLEEAHSRLVSLETVAAAAQSAIDPRIKLRLLLTRIVAEITNRDSTAWELRVLSREILSPSPMMEGLVRNQIAPKATFLRAILAEIVGVPVDHPIVSRVLISVIGPCIMLLITNRTLQQKVAPKLDMDAESLTEHMIAYALGGMQAVAKRAGSESRKKRSKQLST
jgi:TetR/AcrR family transcriptional regulator, regulator of cefoperazone and chloramphenicol sensitivity